MMTMKKITMNSKIMAILICLLTLFPSGAKAQMGFDVTSVEAYINDHKQSAACALHLGGK